jgi:plasmid stability protein
VPSAEVKPQHLTLRLDQQLVEALRRRAKRNDRSVSAEARIAIREYLAQEKEAA